MNEFNPLANQQAVGALDDQTRKNTAFNALAKIYGPVANDPAAAVTMQEYGQRQLTNPIAVDQANANLAGTNLTNTGQSQTNDLNAAINPNKIIQSGQVVQENQQTLDHNAVMNPIAEGAAKEAAAYAALAHPKELAGLDLKNQGQTLQNANTAQTTQFDAQLQPGKLKQQAATTALTGAQTANAYSEAGEHSAQAKKTLSEVGVLAAKVNAKAGTQSGLVNPDGTIPYATQAKIGGAIDAVDSVQKLIPRMSKFGVIRAFNATHVPGSPEAQAVAQLHTITANLSQADLQSLAAAGVHMGRVTNMEMKLAGDSYGNTDIVNGDPVAISKTLGAVRNVLSNFGTGANPTTPTIGGRVAAGPAPTSKFIDGGIYTSKDGSRAMYQGGKWVPVPGK